MCTTNIKKIKEPKTYEEQLGLLKSRGLIVKDEKQALHILKRTNYYRLSAYMLTYKDTRNEFVSGTYFEEIYRLYEFDRKLRNILLAMLEKIEIAFRTHIAYFTAHKYGPLGYKDAANFKNEHYYNEMLAQMDKEVARSSELFIKHHVQMYGGNIPVWAIVEVISFGLISKMFRNLRDEDQKVIAVTYYDIKKDYIESWLRSLATIRNVCAHYGRIYNRNIKMNPMLFNKEKKRGIKNNSVFAILFIIGKLLKDDDEWQHYITTIKGLIEQYEVVDLQVLGFPDDWETILRKL